MRFSATSVALVAATVGFGMAGVFALTEIPSYDPPAARAACEDRDAACIEGQSYGPPYPTLPPTPHATASPTPTAPPLVSTKMECAPPTGELGGTLTAVLTTVDDAPLEGMEIQWTDEPGLREVSSNTSTTDATGTAQTQYHVEADLDLQGNETVTATFEGTAEYVGSSCQVTFFVKSDCPPSIPDICGYEVNTNQGDNDCDHDEDATDGLVALRYVAGLDYSQEIDCLPFAQYILVQSRNPALPSGGYGLLFGDVNCDGTVDALDALAILRHTAGMPVFQNEPCSDIGTLL